MKITSKYILREHVGPLVFAFSALTSLLLLNYVAKKFGDLVGKGLPVRAILEFFALSIPFTVAILRYAVDVDGGEAGEPEEIALGDRVLQVLALAWIGVVGVAVYVAG